MDGTIQAALKTILDLGHFPWQKKGGREFLDFGTGW